MIFSSINSKDDFSSYPKAVQRAIKYLKENDFVNMEPGVYELEGKLMLRNSCTGIDEGGWCDYCI